MGYPIDLDEYSNERIIEEYDRRMRCLAEDKCFYCGRDLSDGQRCKINSHHGDK